MDAEIREKLADLEGRIAKIEAALANKSPEKRGQIQSLEAKLVEKAGSMKTQDLIIISLSLFQQQTKAELKKSLADWGKVYGNWFDGGNFNGRLLRKNIVKKDGKKEDGQETFSLTKRGEFIADELKRKVMED